MNTHVSEDDGAERLAKRVAAQGGWSRRDAELLIDNGVVRVDGTVAVSPQMRVRPAQRVEIEKNARPEPVPPVMTMVAPISSSLAKAAAARRTSVVAVADCAVP